MIRSSRQKYRYRRSAHRGGPDTLWTKLLPYLTALTLFLLAPGSTWLDPWLSSNPPSGDLVPIEPHTDLLPPPVLKSSLAEVPETSVPPDTAPELVYTRHRVARDETLSSLAWKYALSPTTLVSINRIDDPTRLKPGRILVIPYKDGARITPANGEDPGEVALLYGLEPSEPKRLPSLIDREGHDLFLPGVLPDPSTLPDGLGETFLFPVPGRIARPFGTVTDDLTGIRFLNDGIDLAVSAGTPVRASRGGLVVKSGIHPRYGRYVIVSHTGDWQSFYGHLGGVDVKTGRKVNQGDILGWVGDTGTARQPLLHFVLLRGDDVVDPLEYLL